MALVQAYGQKNRSDSCVNISDRKTQVHMANRLKLNFSSDISYDIFLAIKYLYIEREV